MSRDHRRHPLPDGTPVEISVDTADEPVIAHIVSDKIAERGVYIVRFSATDLIRGVYPDRVNTTTDPSAWMEAAYLAAREGRYGIAEAFHDTGLQLRAGRTPLTPRPGPILVG
jgi:hypothetical protein